MKHILLLIGITLLFISCETPIIDGEVSNEVKTTGESYITFTHDEFYQYTENVYECGYKMGAVNIMLNGRTDENLMKNDIQQYVEEMRVALEGN